MTTITLGRIAIIVTRIRASKPGPGLWRRLLLWLRHRRTLVELQGAEPRMRRDIGLPPAPDPMQGFAVDPRPLWGIGQTPQPRGEVPRRPPREG
jgi:hypothetical protein